MSAYQRTKGAQAELAVCAALRPWWPDVRRSVRAGTSTHADEGDLTGLGPHLVIQVKDNTGTTAKPKGSFAEGVALDRMLAETRAQRDLVGATLGVLVEKRRGQADALNWWAWIGAAELTAALHGTAERPMRKCQKPGAPVRIRFGDLVKVLIGHG